ncbi:uncharacterized protein LOC114257556 [Camellia sinensis]|uniref:uncharacterized protein LOC114257556 n=1 Tax=Camellia sinensis TaxID=4442 RepID=UPI001035F54F|nr:uncharacterized protein LOC114257556 [Camellia sinensis]
MIVCLRFLHQFSLSREQGFMLGHTKAGEFEKSLHVQSHQRLVFLHLLSSLFSEMYTRAGPQFRDELQRHHLPTSLVVDSLSSHPIVRPMPHQQQSHTFSSQEVHLSKKEKNKKKKN